MSQGRTGASTRRYLASRPDAAEVDAIALLIRLAEEFQTPVHIVHLSSAQALPMLAAARKRGVPVTVETCAQYLWFAAEDIPDGATEFKCAPPIRDTANREKLWRALEDGQIDMVTTDHSPCPPEMKHRDNRAIRPGLGRNLKSWPGSAGNVDCDATARPEAGPQPEYRPDRRMDGRRARATRRLDRTKRRDRSRRRRRLCSLRSRSRMDRNARRPALPPQNLAISRRETSRACSSKPGCAASASFRAGKFPGEARGREQVRS